MGVVFLCSIHELRSDKANFNFVKCTYPGDMSTAKDKVRRKKASYWNTSKQLSYTQESLLFQSILVTIFFLKR